MATPVQPALFAPVAQSRPSSTEGMRVVAGHGVRLRVPVRHQVIATYASLDGRLAADHRVRGVVALIEGLPQDGLLGKILARGSNAGAPAISPTLLLSLWVWALTDGVASAREIARLVNEHDVYRWIAGGVNVSAHVLSDFRKHNGETFYELVIFVVAMARRHGLVELWRTAQDGTRVRADAAPDSFRREATLEECRIEAEQHLREVLASASDAKLSAVAKAAQERGARDRLARVEAALAELPKVLEAKERNGADLEKSPPRTSTTDAEARVMKMPDGGFRPGYNLQFAENVEGALKLIVGVAVTNSGSDQPQATPMREQLAKHYGSGPTEHLVDGGYASHDAIDEAASDGCDLLAPLPKPRAGARPSGEARASDSKAVAEWRERMQTDEAKRTYKLRSQICELPHADGKKDRGLGHLPIRGLDGAFACASLFALTFNLGRVLSYLLADGSLPSTV